MTNKAIGKLTILPKTFIFTPKANSNRNVWKRRKNMKRVYCYYVIRLAGWLTCRGGLSYLPWRACGEQTLLSVTLQLALASRLLARGESWQASVGKGRFFTPKTQFSSTPIPNLIGNSTYDNSTTWTTITHEFNGFSTLLTTNFYPKT